MRHTIPTLVSLAMGLGAAATAQAQEWTHSLTPYLWGSGMSGKAAIGTPAGPLDALGSSPAAGTLPDPRPAGGAGE